jgi:hypothetical protein
MAEQSLSLSSLAVIPCKREHQGRLGESGMAPRYLSWVLDHLVAASKVRKVSQEKWERAQKNKSTDSVPLPGGLHIQDQFAAVEGLKLF